MADVVTPAFLLAYLQLSQSFFIVLDASEVFVQQQFIKRSGLPNLYVAYAEPVYPLVTGLGRHPEYWHTYEDRQYAITIYDNVIENKLFTTVGEQRRVSVDRGNRPTDAGRISAAYFLEIGSDI